MREPLRFDDKTVLITGGAGGLGSAMARLFASRGARVVIVDIDGDRAAALARDIASGAGRAIGVGADITSEKAVEQAFAAARREFGPVAVLINNAMNADPAIKTGDFLGIRNLTQEVWNAHMAVNGLGALFCAKQAIDDMTALGGGVIVNIVSVAGLKGGHAMAAYGASKAALVSLTRHLAVSLGKKNIRCNAVAPGTCMHERNAQSLTPEMLDTSSVLVNRLGNADDIAYAAAFLASDEAGYITGQILPVDGGGTVGKITAMPIGPETAP